ncbi:bestrophin family protein [Dyadobacter sp. 3J3]|uniref:bestrophin family protein n=1 Tax=Dyadobacter sp. 3J3 TaxID=2606600 RepID=UPI00135AE6FB|nr:bestrophin family ion channel [Dyadobacter sp. 3J3]
MYTAREIKLNLIFKFSWRSVLFFLIYSSSLFLLNFYFEIHIGVSFVPIGLIGTAVAFSVGFKNNASYSRLWDSRRSWGGMINASRSFGAYITSFITSTDRSTEETAQIKEEIIYRHIAYLNTVRIQLRRKSVWGDTSTVAHKVVGKDNHAQVSSDVTGILLQFLPEIEAESYARKKNVATQIMKKQTARITHLAEQGCISETGHRRLMELAQEFYNHQGACEAIKSFPFPRQYAYYSKLFVWLFILILPFGLLTEFAKLNGTTVWLGIPLYVVIAWIFHTMEVVGDTSENPFENAINDVPMTAICRIIEIDLRDMLNEENIPAPIDAIDNILM